MMRKAGFIDREGKIVINPQYTNVASDYTGIVTMYMLNDDKLFVSSDYFDVEAITSQLFKDSGSDLFRGISGNTTFGEIKEMYRDLSYESVYSRKSNETVALNSGVSISQTIFRFPEELSKSSYNYYSNTYDTQENTTVTIASIEYIINVDYNSKAWSKMTNIMQGVVAAIVKRYNVDENSTSLISTDAGMVVHTSSIEFNVQKYGSDIHLQVSFK